MTEDEKLVNLFQNDLEKFGIELRRIVSSNENHVLSVILEINADTSSLKNSAEILKHFNEALNKNLSLIQRLLLYIFCYWYDYRLHRLEEANVILQSMANLINEDTPAPLQAAYRLITANTKPDELDALVKIQKVLSLLPKDCDQYKRAIIELCGFYIDVSRFKDFDKLTTLEIPKEYYNIIKFFDCVESWRIEEALIHKKNIEDNSNYLTKLHAASINYYTSALGLLKTQSNEEQDAFQLSTKALLNKDASLALSYAKEIEHNSMHTASSLIRLCRIRAEISSKHIETSHLLIEKEDQFRSSYIIDFFRARLELLKGNFDLAVEYFSNVFHLCKEYDLMGRLDFEMELAVELKPGQIRLLIEKSLIQNSDKKKSKKISPKKITSKAAFGLERIKGKSLVIEALKKNILKYAVSDIPVLILGETGVGKDVVANALHEESNQKSEPFIAINCSAITESLLQSELFGHVAGAYTGATKSHKGIFEEAGKGTVFLDEIGDISSHLQAALLRVLESGEIRPVGSAKARPIHCRIITATNALLESRVDQGLFRLDLLYRLKRLVIKIPPLRERSIDISLLADYFLNQNRLSAEKAIFNDELKEAFTNHAWPGNVRELKNEIENMRLLNSEKIDYNLPDAPFLLSKEKEPSRVKENNTKELDVEKITTTPHQQTKTNNILAATEKVLGSSNSYFRRVVLIKDLFQKNKQLTRKEICLITGVSDKTIGRDIKNLIKESFILKVEPTKSPRTHYFILNEMS